jgi:hypothetical protein
VVKRASNVHVWGVCAFHRFIMRKVMNDEEAGWGWLSRECGGIIEQRQHDDE